MLCLPWVRTSGTALQLVGAGGVSLASAGMCRFTADEDGNSFAL